MSILTQTCNITNFNSLVPKALSLNFIIHVIYFDNFKDVMLTIKQTVILVVHHLIFSHIVKVYVFYDMNTSEVAELWCQTKLDVQQQQRDAILLTWQH